MISILIVDDQKSVRARLEYLVESVADFRVAGIAKDGLEAISGATSLQPDIILLDMQMPQIDGFTAIRLITAEAPHTKILVLSSHDRPEYVAESMSAGAMGYLLKGASDQEIEQAIRFVYKGHTHMGAGLFAKMLPIMQAQEIDILQSREEVISLVPGEDFVTINSPKSIRSTASTQSALAIIDSPEEISAYQTEQEQNTGKKQILAWLILAVGLTTGIYGMRQWLRQPVTALSYTQQSATIADTKFSGKLQPAKTFKIAAIAPGVVENIQVKVGEKVEVGQPLLTLKNLAAEDQKKQIVKEQQLTKQQQQAVLQQQQSAQQRVFELEQKISHLKYSLSPLKARIAEANLRMSLAKSAAAQHPLGQKQDSVLRTQAIYQRATARFNRLASLHNQGAISQEQLEQAQAELDIAQVDYDMARAANAASQKLESSQRELSQLREKLAIQEQQDAIANLKKQKQTASLEYQQSTEKLALLNQQAKQLNEYQIPDVRRVIAATEAGVISELPVAIGDQIYAGSAVVGLAKLEMLKISVPVNARIINGLDEQQEALIYLGSGVTAEKFAGKIATVNPIPNENLNYLVEVEFANPTKSLIIGQLAQVQFLPQTIAGGK